MWEMQMEERGSGLSIDRETLYLTGAGALAAAAFLLLMRKSRSLKPTTTAAMKEAYGFKEWLLTQVESFAADAEDAAAEAKHSFEREKDLDSVLEALAEDKDLLGKLRKIVEKASAKAETVPTSTPTQEA